MSPFDEIRTPHRRPCLLRARTESNVDSPAGKYGGSLTSDRHGHPLTAEGGGTHALDDRALTLDTPARLPGRCTGLHKANYDSTPSFSERPKGELLRSMQAFGIQNTNDVTMNVHRRRANTESPEPGVRRTKAEAMQGLPFSGQGADIDLMGGRRVRGMQESVYGAAGGPNDAKIELGAISIDHQFRRRQCTSVPPPSSACSSSRDSQHRIRAEDYANLLGRPEGMGKRSILLERSRRGQQNSPGASSRGNCSGGTSPGRGAATRSTAAGGSTSPGSGGGGAAASGPSANSGTPRTPQGAHSVSSAAAAGTSPLLRLVSRPSFKDDSPLPIHTEEESVSEGSVPAAALITALRDATRNTPAEAVWQTMLNDIEAKGPETAEGMSQHAEVFSKVSAVIDAATAAVASPSIVSRVGSPTSSMKGRCLSHPVLGVGRGTAASILGTSLSSASLMSEIMETEPRFSPTGLEKGANASTASTAAISFTSASSTSLASAVAAGAWAGEGVRGNAGQSECRSPQHQRARRSREEQWKARRRAAWVA